MFKEKYRILYLCNGKRCDKKDDPYCALLGLDHGECKHTNNAEFSKNGECLDPWNHPERFHEVVDQDGVIIFLEEE